VHHKQIVSYSTNSFTFTLGPVLVHSVIGGATDCEDDIELMLENSDSVLEACYDSDEERDISTARIWFEQVP
jgi:hypothetical protein